MDKHRINKYNKKNGVKGKVIPMPIVQEFIHGQEESQKDLNQNKKSKKEIAREIANQFGIYGKSFGRTMSEHHKQGR